METYEHMAKEAFGQVKMSDDVIAVCAIHAVLKTSGVAGLTGGLTDSISETILGKESLSKGVKVNQSEEGILLDVFVIVNYGVKIPAIAWNIQTNVKKEIENMTDKKVLAVNIHIQGVVTPKQEEKNE